MQPNPQRGHHLIGLISLVLILITFILVLLQFLGVQNKKLAISYGNDFGFLDTFNGTVTGKVTSIDKGMLTIENKNGKNRQYKASTALLVPELGDQGVVAPTTDLSKIDKSKEYTFTLGLNEGQLEVFTMMLVLAPGQMKQTPIIIPVNPPTATSSASRVTPLPVAPTATKLPASTPEP